MTTEIEVIDILTDPNHQINLRSARKQRNLSSQVQNWFTENGWEKEKSSFSIPEMKYYLVKETIPIEIELGHQRLVFPYFFQFLADYSKEQIPAAIMIVTGNPDSFGHNWHCSLQSTKRKIDAIREAFLVPLLLIAINP